MLIEFPILSEALITLVTYKRLFTIWNQYMLIEILRLSKALNTLVAAKQVIFHCVTANAD